MKKRDKIIYWFSLFEVSWVATEINIFNHNISGGFLSLMISFVLFLFLLREMQEKA